MCSLLCHGVEGSSDSGGHGKYGLGQTQQAFLAEGSVAEEQWAQLKGCAGVGRRGSFLPCSFAYFRHSVFRMETALAVFLTAFLLEPSTPLLAPQQIRGPSVSDSSMRLSALFVLFFPAVKTVSHCLCYCLYLGFWADSLCSPTTGYIAWSSCEFGDSC